MDIKGLGPLSAYEQFKIKQQEESLRPDKNVKESSADKQGDEVAVSGEARLRGAIFSEASKSTGVDNDKVARLKAMVESGEYRPDAKSIASSMIREELEEWDL